MALLQNCMQLLTHRPRMQNVATTHSWTPGNAWRGLLLGNDRGEARSAGSLGCRSVNRGRRSAFPGGRGGLADRSWVQKLDLPFSRISATVHARGSRKPRVQAVTHKKRILPDSAGPCVAWAVAWTLRSPSGPGAAAVPTCSRRPPPAAPAFRVCCSPGS